MSCTCHADAAQSLRIIASHWNETAHRRQGTAEELISRIKAEIASECARHIDMLGQQVPDGRVVEVVDENLEKTAEIEPATARRP